MNKIHEKETSPSVGDSRRSLAELLEQLKQMRNDFQAQAEMTPEKAQKILQARAQEIRAGGVEEDAGELLEILEFTLGKEHYAFPLEWVGGVCRVDEITEIPGTPAFVKGVVNIRSRIYSVVDLVTFLALSVNPEAVSALADEMLLILVSGETEFAVAIDSLEGVRTLPIKSLQTNLPTLSGAQAEYFRGMTTDYLVLLDAEKLLQDKKIVVD